MSLAYVREKHFLYSQLKILLRARVPLGKALSAVCEKLPAAPLREACLTAVKELELGQPLSSALEKNPAVFSAYETGVVRASESGPGLETGIAALAAVFAGHSARSASQRAGNLIIIFTIVLTFSLIAFLLLFIVPTFENIFQALNLAQLPVLTGLVVHNYNLSAVLFLIVLPLLLALGWAGHRYRPEPASRLFTLIPWVGSSWMRREAAHFARAAGEALEAGMAEDQAVDTGAAFVDHAFLQSRLRSLSGGIKQGADWLSGLSGIPKFPPLLPALAKLGRGQGDMGKALLEYAEVAEDEGGFEVHLSGVLGGVAMLFAFLAVILTAFILYLPIFEMVGRFEF